MRLPVVFLLSLLLPSLLLASDLSREARTLERAAQRAGRASELRDRDREGILEALAEVSDEELDLVIARLREEKSERSLPAVIRLLEDRRLGRSYGETTLAQFPDLGEILAGLADADPDVKLTLLRKVTGLSDLRLAREIVLRLVGDEDDFVRLQTSLVLGDLFEYTAKKEDRAVFSDALLGRLEDPSPAVRAVAIRRAFEARLDPVIPFAMEHLDDRTSARAVVRGEEQDLIPGAEALSGLARLVRPTVDVDYPMFLDMTAGDRVALRRRFLEAWEGYGCVFPPRGAGEAEFRPEPAREEVKVLAEGEPAVTFDLWAGIDRTRMRLRLEEIDLRPVAPLGHLVTFRVRYMAQGMRQDDGEGFARNHPVGTPWVLPRRAIGSYVLHFRPLVDRRLEVTLRFHDPVR